jgi:hypothetical protein
VRTESIFTDSQASIINECKNLKHSCLLMKVITVVGAGGDTFVSMDGNGMNRQM